MQRSLKCVCVVNSANGFETCTFKRTVTETKKRQQNTTTVLIKTAELTSVLCDRCRISRIASGTRLFRREAFERLMSPSICIVDNCPMDHVAIRHCCQFNWRLRRHTWCCSRGSDRGWSVRRWGASFGGVIFGSFAASGAQPSPLSSNVLGPDTVKDENIRPLYGCQDCKHDGEGIGGCLVRGCLLCCEETESPGKAEK